MREKISEKAKNRIDELDLIPNYGLYLVFTPNAYGIYDEYLNAFNDTIEYQRNGTARIHDFTNHDYGILRLEPKFIRSLYSKDYDIPVRKIQLEELTIANRLFDITIKGGKK